MAAERLRVKAACIASASFLAAAAFAAAASEGPDFDAGVRASSALDAAKARAKAAPGMEVAGTAIPDDKTFWVSFGSSDLIHPDAADFPLKSPASQSELAAVFQAPARLLPALSGFMHRRFKRCGGFFAHRTRQEAEADLVAAGAKQGGPYSIDQQAFVKPLVARVQEGELRGTIETLAAYDNRYYTADSGVEAARWLKGRWQALAGKLPGSSVELVSHDGWPQPSVVLTIPGFEKPDEIVVLGGHLDSINGWGGEDARAPGADDNASGVAVLTEAVRVLGESGFRPRRTVQFMGYAAEEVGLLGSQDIAQRYAREGKKVVGVIQYDMTNFKGSAEEIFLLTDNVDQSLTAFLGKLIDAYVGVAWSTTQCGYACSDHASWTRSGYPASVAFESSFEGMNHALHTERDTLATAGGDAGHSVNFAKLAVAFAVELAKTTTGVKLAERPGPAPRR